MGGMFSPQQTPAQVIDTTSAALSPFRDQLVKAAAGLFGPQQGVTPLEEATIRGSFQQAVPLRGILEQQAMGQFLPGQAQGNPFLSALEAGFERNANISRQQLASAAQRSGALNSTSYLDRARDLEGDLFERRAGLMSNLYEAERGRQQQAVPLLQGLASQLLGFAGRPREVATEQTRWPFTYGASLLSGAGGNTQVIPGQTSPSPFSTLLNLWAAAGLPGVIF